jgi:hypothetical protein
MSIHQEENAVVVNQQVLAVLERVVSLLVAGELEELQRMDRGGRMRSDEWRARLNEYGRTLITPPASDFVTADVVRITGQSAWSVWYRLWTADEGKSDLGLELTVRDRGADTDVELEDLRVT